MLFESATITDGRRQKTYYITQSVESPVGEAVRQVERVLVEVRLDNEGQRPERLKACSRKLVLEVAGVRPSSVPPHAFLLHPRLQYEHVDVWCDMLVRRFLCSTAATMCY